MLTPTEIVEILDKYVIGQDKAKKVLAVAVYNHTKRLKDKTGHIRKSNILMTGSSGSGKTLLAQTLAQVLDVPFVITDATSLTEAGYVGDDVENILKRLIDAADGDIERAQKGIIYIDEIDKFSRKGEGRSNSRDVSGEGVQHALLKIIEGADVSVHLEGGRKHPFGKNVMINTNNILFICGGAFEGLVELSKEKTKTIGFNCEITEEDTIKKVSDDITADMFVKYGMTPELMGRLPIIVSLNDLDEEDLVQVLTEPKGALVKEYRELLAVDEVELEFEEEALREIAKLAIDNKTGARGLRSIMENVMMDIMYMAPDNKNSRCVITKETIYTKEPIYEVA